MQTHPDLVAGAPVETATTVPNVYPSDEREQGRHAREFFTTVKTAYVRP